MLVRCSVMGIVILAAATATRGTAADVPVVPRKLIVVDRVAAVGTAKVVFVAKDAGVAKGAGLDPEQISVHFTVAYGNGGATGALAIPAGTANGWRSNKATVAKYVNKAAPAGPTQAKVAVVKPAKLIKLVGKGLGDPPLNVSAAGDPAGAVFTAYCVDNAGEEHCHCSAFSDCGYKTIAGGTGAKLVCRGGSGDAGCAALAATTTTSTTTPTSTTTTTTVPAGDTFDGVALDPSWSVLNPGLVTIDVSGGSLNLEPAMSGAGTTWFDDSEGPLVYKAVTGDFDVRTVVVTEDAGSPGDPPPTQYRLAGLLARDPASVPGSLDWVHVALGSGATAQGVCYEYKSTDASVSTWMTIPTASPAGELRLVRAGAVFDLYWRPDAVSVWTLIQSFVRPDLPPALHVGLMIYATEAPSAIRARFDEIAFF
jgi:hypothetical protein